MKHDAMRPSSRGFAFIVAVILQMFSAHAYALKEGELPPEVTLPSNRGAEIRLSELKGKVVFVDFWASWCGSCAKSIPWLSKLQARLGEKNFQVLAVNVDEERTLADEFLTRSSAQLLVGYDPEGVTPEAFNVQAMPTSFLVDREGKIIFVHEGFADQDMANLEEKIRTALGS